MDITSWGAGINDDEPGSSWFKRNKTKVYTLGLFTTLGVVFYLVGWINLARVCGLMVGIQLFTNLVQGIRNFFKK